MKIKFQKTRKITIQILWFFLFAVNCLFSCTQKQETFKTIQQPSDGSVLPFPEPASASVTGKTLQDPKHQWRKAESHLPADVPNIVIFMTDDADFANPGVFGGPINMPTMERLANSGICYIETKYDTKERMVPATLTLKVNGNQVGQERIERSIPGVHTASETFDIGVDLGSPVALDYYDQAPFRFSGRIEKINIRYINE